jgi:hypothetical protein
VNPVGTQPILDAGSVAQPDAVEVTFTVQRDDAPAANARVSLRQTGFPSANGSTDATGTVKLSLQPGSWKVAAPFEASPPNVTVEPSTRAVTLRIAPKEVLTGCVVDEAGKPARARLLISEVGREPTETGDDGCFSTTVRGPTVKVQAMAKMGSSESQGRHRLVSRIVSMARRSCPLRSGRAVTKVA